MLLILCILGGVWLLGSALFVGGLMLSAKRQVPAPEYQMTLDQAA